MPKSRPPYPPELRRRLVEMLRAGKSPAKSAQELGRSGQAIRNWAAQQSVMTGQAAAEIEESTQ